ACQRRAASRITKRCCRGTAHQLLPLLPEKTRPPGRGLWSGYVGSMGKDGRSYWPIKRQDATADRIANFKGRSPQERAALKKRLLRKWMSK
ncbi:hypothetical protein ACTX1L_29515, partial [Pseudomonas aeruginosa]